ncbi:hypothetical protein ACFE04_020115 [Oxalis oulophora]
MCFSANEDDGILNSFFDQINGWENDGEEIPMDLYNDDDDFTVEIFSYGEEFSMEISTDNDETPFDILSDGYTIYVTSSEGYFDGFSYDGYSFDGSTDGSSDHNFEDDNYSESNSDDTSSMTTMMAIPQKENQMTHHLKANHLMVRTLILLIT